jgi:iron complex outermembrane receptor protein
MLKIGHFRACLCSSVAVLALTATSAWAQDAAASGGGEQVETVTVTGSRISTPGFEAPTPMTVLAGKSLQMYTENGLEALEYDIPELAPNETTVGQAGGGALSTYNLRNLGATRTLILMNGMRVMPTDPLAGTVDVNTFPAVLINNIGVVTGGAGASYGSDAVSGVVNLSLDNKLNGFKGSAQAGESEYSDYRNYDLSAAYGTDFGSGNAGHIVIAGEMYHNNGVCCQGSRPWGNKSVGLIANPNSKPGNGIPQLQIASNTNLSVEADNGLITSGPLRGTTFTANGTPTPFAYGQNVGTVFQVGGGGTNFAPYGNIFPEQARMNAYAHAEYDINPGLHVFAEVLAGRQQSYYPVITNFDSGDITVGINNAYLPSSVRTQMVANGVTSFSLGRSNFDLGGCSTWNGVQECGMAVTDYKYNTYHTAVGASGDVRGWTWKWFAQYNSDTMVDSIHNDKVLTKFANSVNSQINPATGQPSCVSTLTNPNDGCVPVNLFGSNTITPAVTAYTNKYFRLPETETELDTAFDVQGTAFTDWAGDVSLAGGLEWRRESANGVNDPDAVSGNLFTAALAIQGHYNVAEAYLETVVPLAKDLSWAKKLELDVAAREAYYSTSGYANTWKAGVNYTPFDDQLRFRGTFSHDLRAPNLAELYQPQVYNINTVQNDFQSGAQTSIRVYTGGNSKLVPEQANSFTGGFVFQPNFIEGLQGSIDYFRTTVHGAINTLTQQQVVDFCFAGQKAYCSAITSTTGDPATGSITAVSAVKFNFQQLFTEGVDTELTYRFEGTKLWSDLPGDFTLRMLSNYVDHLQTIASGQTVDYAGQVGLTTGLPHLRVNFTALWDWDPISLQANVRYTQGGTLNATYIQGVTISPADDHIASRAYLDLSGTWDAYEHLQLFGKVGNVFNTAPPNTPTNILKPLTAASPYYDDIGRVYSMGVRVQF